MHDGIDVQLKSGKFSCVLTQYTKICLCNNTVYKCKVYLSPLIKVLYIKQCLVYKSRIAIREKKLCWLNNNGSGI